eukprot:6122354-Prymnesium_polylepis.1
MASKTQHKGHRSTTRRATCRGHISPRAHTSGTPTLNRQHTPTSLRMCGELTGTQLTGGGARHQ